MAAKNMNDLDDLTLAKIFNYLDIDDWIDFSQMTKRFGRVIREHVIPVNKINVVGPHVNYSMTELFQMFGKCMTKLGFDAEDYVFKGPTRNRIGSVFEMFLQMLLDYCEPGILKEFGLYVNEKIQNRLIDQDLLTRTAVYFKNVTRLTIQLDCDGKEYSVTAIERWLASIPDEQIRDLHIRFLRADQYDFKLHPNSFHNIRHLQLSFEPSNERSLNKVTDFIQGKSNLRGFCFDGLGDEIIKTVANSFPNLKVIGCIDLNSKPEDIHLEQFKDLIGVFVRGSMANYQEFHNIFKIIASQKTLQVMDIDLISTEDSTIRENFLSFLKSDCIREKIYLKELHFDSYDFESDVEMYLNYLIVSVFNFKTLVFNNGLSYKLIKSAVANVGCLENLVFDEMGSDSDYDYEYGYDSDDYSEEFVGEHYKKWIMERVMMKHRLGTSNRLTMYVSDAKKCILQLGSDYDPQLIAMVPKSKFVGKTY